MFILMPLKQSKDFYQRHNHLRYAELLVHELIMSKRITRFYTVLQHTTNRKSHAGSLSV